ncbi:MAG: zf-HC2 domain-containing protein [Planctomycetota bacterium]|nr:zf-HC2 domain-containing protein [Planctomycetota bacterium]
MSELDPKPETCADIEARLPLFVGGDLEPDTQEAVAVHLARCDACRDLAERFDQVRATHQAAMEPLRGEPAPDLWPGVRERLVDEGVLADGPGGGVIPGPGSPWRSSGFRRVAAALGAVAAGGLLWIGLRLPFGDDELRSNIVAPSAPSETPVVAGSESDESDEPAAGSLERVLAGEPRLWDSVPVVPFERPNPNVLTTDR